MSEDDNDLSDPFLKTAVETFRRVEMLEQQLLEAAKAGEVFIVRKMLKEADTLRGIEPDHAVLFAHMIATPEQFKQKTALLETVLDMPFDRETMFASISCEGSDMRPDMWTMYARDTRPDTLRASAMLIAEAIRTDLRFNTAPFQPWSMISTPETISEIFTSEKMKSAIVATQHALVDYVAASDKNNFAKAGGFLKFSDFMDGSDLWTKKVNIRETRTDSIRNGPGIKYTPVFG